MGLVATKHVFGVSDKARLKPVSSATETSYKTEILLAASLNMVLSKMRITKALIRLRECAVWSAPVLFANPWKQVFSCWGPYNLDTHTWFNGSKQHIFAFTCLNLILPRFLTQKCLPITSLQKFKCTTGYSYQGSKHFEPWSTCSLGSSLISVHIAWSNWS